MLFCNDTCLIPVTEEAEARLLQVQGQHGQLCETLSQNKKIKKIGDVTWG